MVKVVLPSGLIHHAPPYTDAEVAEMYRRLSNIVSFTRPGGQRAGAAPEPDGEEAEPGGVDAVASPGDPSVDPAPS